MHPETLRGSSDGLADRLRHATREWHARAERSGIVRDVLNGRVHRQDYALLLRNLLPVYAELEQGLEIHRRSPGVRAIVRPELNRAAVLEADLTELYGADWRQRLVLLPAAGRYAERISAAARGDGTRLIAHAYVRYLGDLNGGRIVQRLLNRVPCAGLIDLGFHDFSIIPDIDTFKVDYRVAYDHAGRELEGSPDLIQGVIDEAVLAFGDNIALSEAVRTTAADPG
jgi:heme oxygenase